MAGIAFVYEDDQGDEIEIELPARYEVCGRCRGEGSHVNPSIDGHGITEDEWNGPDWDDESRDAYMSGAYDVACEVCNGDRVVLVPDEERADRAMLARYEETQRDLAECLAIMRAERAMGA